MACLVLLSYTVLYQQALPNLNRPYRTSTGPNHSRQLLYRNETAHSLRHNAVTLSSEGPSPFSVAVGITTTAHHSPNQIPHCRVISTRDITSTLITMAKWSHIETACCIHLDTRGDLISDPSIPGKASRVGRREGGRASNSFTF